MVLLSVKNLSQSFGKKKILNNVSFDILSGQVVAFLGPNGAGKTTLLKTVIGLIKSDSYDKNNEKNIIQWNGKIINDWSVSARIGDGLVYLPQQASLFLDFSVLDNLLIVFQYHPYWAGKSKKEFEDEMDFWLQKALMSNTLNQKAQELSGGQKRKIEVIRSLLMHPKVMMLDEPFAGVDPKSIYELKLIFVELAKSGIGVLVSDHNVDQLLSIANLIYVVINGEIVTSGSVKDIMQNEFTKNSYFGVEFFSEMASKFLK